MKAYNFSQKKLNYIWVSSICLIVILMAASTWNLRNAAQIHREIQNRRSVCGEYCDNLEEATGYLSEQARNYVITGKQKYLDDYWEEVYTGKRRDSVVKGLEELGISDKKLGLLKSAKSYSDLLIYLETRAMRLAADTYWEAGNELPPKVEEYIIPSLTVRELKTVVNTLFMGLTTVFMSYTNYSNIIFACFVFQFLSFCFC